ncbi:hypothetical protein BJX70DRAFT_78845 [Aspergillus crustosus]
MPGVPSGRGCDNCRKSKKKCDQKQPACTRCARRGIECIGAGEKRWKFMEEGPTTIAKKRSPKQPSTTPSTTPPAEQTQHTEPNNALRRVSIFPSNSVTLLAQSLTSAMGKKTDVTYNLGWAYGGYLALIPQRLGVNRALDTAVDALVTAHRSFASQKVVTVSALSKYSQALGALRMCLDNPRTASSSETLCAVMVLLSVQHIVGPADMKWTGHAEGAARILKARKNCAPRDVFERILMLSLRGPVLFEGLFNPNINLTPEEWNELVVSELDANTPEGSMMRNLSLVPDIMHRVKTNTDGLAGLLILQAELKSIYTKTREIVDSLGVQVSEIENSTSKTIPNPFGLSPRMLHAHTQRFYGIAITIALYMNYALVLMKVQDPTLSEDAIRLASEMMTVAENAGTYRPFGAAYVSLGLVAAWVAVDKVSVRLLLESWLDDYCGDFNMPRFDALGIIQAFNELDPFDGSSPVAYSETEEEAVYKHGAVVEGPIQPELAVTPATDPLSDFLIDPSMTLPAENSMILPVGTSRILAAEASTDILTDLSPDFSTDFSLDLSTDFPLDFPLDLPIEFSTDLPTEIPADLF